MIEIPQVERERERLEFYAAIGEAITIWADIEGSLFDLYARLLKSNHFQALSATYHAVINFNTKLQMVDAAAVYVLKRKKHQAEWNALRNKLSRAAKRRNAVAHLSAQYAPQRRAGKRYALAPGAHDLREESVVWMFNFYHPPYTRARLLTLIKSFELLRERLRRFLVQLPVEPARRREAKIPLIKGRHQATRHLAFQKPKER